MWPLLPPLNVEKYYRMVFKIRKCNTEEHIRHSGQPMRKHVGVPIKARKKL
jgi:hypothetical protein